MKRLNVTYHMSNSEGIAETCITLPVTDEVAADVLELGARSERLDRMQIGELYRLLRSLSVLQGYEYAGFCCAELEEDRA